MSESLLSNIVSFAGSRLLGMEPRRNDKDSMSMVELNG